ncbi:MAG: hypothetical protein KAV82_14720, partial [Phycisphaerae bacterium]|nr:hypothetical protein [Phycisphaerae bacterium]
AVQGLSTAAKAMGQPPYVAISCLFPAREAPGFSQTTLEAVQNLFAYEVWAHKETRPPRVSRDGRAC